MISYSFCSNVLLLLGLACTFFRMIAPCRFLWCGSCFLMSCSCSAVAICWLTSASSSCEVSILSFMGSPSDSAVLVSVCAADVSRMSMLPARACAMPVFRFIMRSW